MAKATRCSPGPDPERRRSPRARASTAPASGRADPASASAPRRLPAASRGGARCGPARGFPGTPPAAGTPARCASPSAPDRSVSRRSPGPPAAASVTAPRRCGEPGPSAALPKARQKLNYCGLTPCGRRKALHFLLKLERAIPLQVTPFQIFLPVQCRDSPTSGTSVSSTPSTFRQHFQIFAAPCAPSFPECCFFSVEKEG